MSFFCFVSLHSALQLFLLSCSSTPWRVDSAHARTGVQCILTLESWLSSVFPSLATGAGLQRAPNFLMRASLKILHLLGLRQTSSLQQGQLQIEDRTFIPVNASRLCFGCKRKYYLVRLKLKCLFFSKLNPSDFNLQGYDLSVILCQ